MNQPKTGREYARQDAILIGDQTESTAKVCEMWDEPDHAPANLNDVMVGIWATVTAINQLAYQIAVLRMEIADQQETPKQ